MSELPQLAAVASKRGILQVEVGVEVDESGEARRIGEARAWLRRCRKLAGYRDSLEDAARAQIERADGLKGIDYTRDKVDASPYADAIPDAVAMHMETGDAFKAIAEDASRRITQAALALSGLDDPDEARCLTLYYLDSGGGHPAKCWEEVCCIMGYEYDSIMKMQRRALLHAYNVMPHSERGPVESAL